MDERTTELRKSIDERRSVISDTVTEIENRVHPGHVAARKSHRLKRRLGDWKDTIMGGNDTESRHSGSQLAESVREAPEEIRRRTQGNPWALGLVAVGTGALIASLLPETQKERDMAADAQQGLHKAASAVGAAGREVVSDVKSTLQESVEHVREAATTAGDEVAQDARAAGERVVGGGVSDSRSSPDTSS